MKKRYVDFSPWRTVVVALNYFIEMSDKNRNGLPFGEASFDEYPTHISHVRTDCSIVSALWYEALLMSERAVKTDLIINAKKSYYNNLMDFCKNAGLLSCRSDLFSDKDGVAVYEAAYIISALNAIIKNDPCDSDANTLSENTVNALYSVATRAKASEACVFPDIEAFELPCNMPEKALRIFEDRDIDNKDLILSNAALIHPLTEKYIISGDKKALDLAKGITEYILGCSDIFNEEMHFTGNAYFAACFARGAVLLGKTTNNDVLFEKGKKLYMFIRSKSLIYGWIPRTVTLGNNNDPLCETRCVAEMTLCALELAKAGVGKCWDDVNLLARNQLVESQIKYTKHYHCLPGDNDTYDTAYRFVNRKMLGGFAAYTTPGSLPQNKNGNPSASASGLAAKAIIEVMENAITVDGDCLTYNIPMNLDTEYAELRNNVPNYGAIGAKIKKPCALRFRYYSWMGSELILCINGIPENAEITDGLIGAYNLKEGDLVTLSFKTKQAKYTSTKGKNRFDVTLCGHDVICVSPPADPMRMYQRDSAQPLVLPKRTDIKFSNTKVKKHK